MSLGGNCSFIKYLLIGFIRCTIRYFDQKGLRKNGILSRNMRKPANFWRLGSSLLCSLAAHGSGTELQRVRLPNHLLTCVYFPKMRISKPVTLKLCPFVLKGQWLAELFNIQLFRSSYMALRSSRPLVHISPTTQQAGVVLLPQTPTGTKKALPSTKYFCNCVSTPKPSVLHHFGNSKNSL